MLRAWETVKKLVAGKTNLISEACVEDGWTLQPPTLYQYQEQYGGTYSGKPNCIDRTNRLIVAARKIGAPYEAWSAPLHDLCHEHRHIAVRLPDKKSELKDVQQGLFRSIKEFSDMTQASSQAMEDGDISKKDAAKIVAEGREVLQQISAYLAEIEAIHTKHGRA